jgi:threonine/homoserine/homoserine lactone efflux protein
MELVHFLRGVIAGFLAAVPIGPVNVLCIQRTLSRGRVIGLVSGLGAATVDAFYGGVAGLGLSMVSELLSVHEELFRLAGGLFVILLGAGTMLAGPRALRGEEHEVGLPGAYFSTLLLTLANPTTIFSYGLLFAGLGSVHALHRVENAVLLVPGVFIGSALWWIILTGTMGALRHRMNENSLKWVNRIAGGIVAGFGLFILLRPR